MLSGSLVDSSKYRVSWPWVPTSSLCWATVGGLCTLSVVQQMKCRFKALFSPLGYKRKAWDKSKGVFCEVYNLRTVCIICCTSKWERTWMLAGNILAVWLCHNTLVPLFVSMYECATCLLFVQRLCAVWDTSAPCHQASDKSAVWFFVWWFS